MCDVALMYRFFVSLSELEASARQDMIQWSPPDMLD